MIREEAIEILSRPRSMKNVPDDIMEAHEMAIKALEQQTCEDAVSRQAVLDIFANNADAVRPYSKTWEEVKDLPSVNPQHTDVEIQKMQELEQAEIQKAYELGKAEESNKWIPVSEKLPLLKGSHKISDDVLITNGFENDMGYLVERKGKIFWHYYGGECEVGIKDEDNDAIAWMPLPQPYEP